MSLNKYKILEESTNNTYEIFLTTTDYEKALADKNFVSRVLNNIKRSGMSPEKEDVEEVMCGPEQSYNKENNSNKNFEDGENFETAIWSTNATLLFLALYQEYAPDIDNGKCSQKTVFQKISKKLSESQFVVSPKQCMTELTSMKRMYKKIKDHNSKSGNDRQTWPYCEQMEEVFGKKPWVKPLCTQSSTGNNLDETVTATIVDEPSAKKTKLSSVVDKHLEKLLEIKEQARQDKKTHHESAMRRLDALNHIPANTK